MTTAQEKFIYYIREYLIEKHGEEFLQLSKEEQDELIFVTFQEFIKSQK